MSNLTRAAIASMGGFQSPLIDTLGGVGTLPTKCIGLWPNPGCKFTDIRSDEDPDVNLAESMNIDGKDIGDTSLYAPCPIFVNEGHLFTIAIISAGSYRAILD